jgi:hypothetical protein
MNTWQKLPNKWRLIAGLLLAGLALLKAQWLILIPAGVLLYLAYRDIKCVLCEAGFCEEGEWREQIPKSSRKSPVHGSAGECLKLSANDKCQSAG